MISTLMSWSFVLPKIVFLPLIMDYCSVVNAIATKYMMFVLDLNVKLMKW